MAFGEEIPPFVLPKTNSGIELEVMREALAYKGHTLIPEYVPLARVPISFKQGEVDAAMTDLGNDLSKFGGHYGLPAVFYDNVFITLKDRNIKIESPKDLEGLSLMSFQGALKRYPDWLTSLNANGNYSQTNLQEVQVKVLFGKRYDVILSDRTIFKYFMLQYKKKQSKLNEKEFTLAPIEEHEFIKLKPSDYRPIFRNKNVRDDFNEGLRYLKKSGKFKAIYDKYLNE
jgi:polar amino acid transport system substrate-binding protein